MLRKSIWKSRPQQNQPQCALLRIPVELKIGIYSYLFSTPGECLQGDGIYAYPSCEAGSNLAILLTCKQIYSECRRMAFENTVIRINFRPPSRIMGTTPLILCHQLITEYAGRTQETGVCSQEYRRVKSEDKNERYLSHALKCIKIADRSGVIALVRYLYITDEHFFALIVQRQYHFVRPGYDGNEIDGSDRNCSLKPFWSAFPSVTHVVLGCSLMLRGEAVADIIEFMPSIRFVGLLYLESNTQTEYYRRRLRNVLGTLVCPRWNRDWMPYVQLPVHHFAMVDGRGCLGVRRFELVDGNECAGEVQHVKIVTGPTDLVRHELDKPLERDCSKWDVGNLFHVGKTLPRAAITSSNPPNTYS